MQQPLFQPATSNAPARVLVIAELGVNHDGSLARALELVALAGEVGADAVKLQLFDADALLSRDALLAGYQRGQAADARGLLGPLRLDVEQVAEVRRAAREAGLGFVITPFSLADVAALRSLDVDGVKIASPDAVNLPLLDAAAALGKPLLVSTGTCELHELEATAKRLGEHAGGACLLQCVSCYPTPDEQAAISGVAALAEQWPLPVGYSDHTTALDAGGLAVAAGACVIEKHLTHDSQAPGPDHAASLAPPAFADYVRNIRRATRMLGPFCKRPLPLEADVRRASRQSLCAARDLPVGHVLGREDLTIKRPGTGIPAARLEQIIGRRLAKSVAANELLGEFDLAPTADASAA